MGHHMVSAVWFLVALSVVICAYIAALVWTGQERKSAKGDNRRHQGKQMAGDMVISVRTNAGMVEVLVLDVQKSEQTVLPITKHRAVELAYLLLKAALE